MLKVKFFLNKTCCSVFTRTCWASNTDNHEDIIAKQKRPDSERSCLAGDEVIAASCSSVHSLKKMLRAFFRFIHCTEPRVVLLRKTGGSNRSGPKKKKPLRASFSLAGDEGFEPPNAWTKTMCLTTWPIPSTCGSIRDCVPTNCTLTGVKAQVATEERLLCRLLGWLFSRFLGCFDNTKVWVDFE